MTYGLCAPQGGCRGRMTQKGKAFDDFEGAVPLFPLKKHSYAKFGYLGSISGSLEVLRLAPGVT